MTCSPRGRIRTPVITVARLGPWAFSPQLNGVETRALPKSRTIAGAEGSERKSAATRIRR